MNQEPADKVKKKRPYNNTKQSEIKALSRQRIIEAVTNLYDEKWLDEITLQQVADRAGVTSKTVIRHFGSKENLYIEADKAFRAQPEMVRQIPEPGNIPDIVRCIVAHYEAMGRRLLRALAQEERIAMLRPVLENGRLDHTNWVQQAFAPYLGTLSKEERKKRQAQLYAITDLYVWKVLRLEQKISHQQTKETIEEMLAALLEP